MAGRSSGSAPDPEKANVNNANANSSTGEFLVNSCIITAPLGSFMKAPVAGKFPSNLLHADNQFRPAPQSPGSCNRDLVYLTSDFIGSCDWLFVHPDNTIMVKFQRRQVADGTCPPANV
jgi:hypothetical protein